MRPKTLTLAIVCAVAIAGLFGPGRQPSVASPAQTEDIDVTIWCPHVAVAVDINWKNHLDGSYSDTGGTGGKLDFEYENGPNGMSVRLNDAYRDGQKILCRYRVSGGVGGLFFHTSYVYKVKRQIVHCLPTNTGMKCKVKP